MSSSTAASRLLHAARQSVRAFFARYIALASPSALAMRASLSPSAASIIACLSPSARVIAAALCPSACKKRFAAVAFRFHLFFHRVLNLRGRNDIFSSTRLTLMPHLSVASSRISVIFPFIVSREVSVPSSSSSPTMLRRVVAARFSSAEMGLTAP